MLVRMAWRNLLRNKRRTLLTLTTITVGVCAVVFGGSFSEAYWAKTIEQITSSQLGQLQVHGKGWQAEPEIGNVVADPAAVEAKLAKALPGASAARRVTGYGLAGAAEQSAAVLILGLEPDREPSGSGPLTVVKGRGFSSRPAKEAVLGRALASQLELAPGGELVLLGQAADGSMANDRYTVVGLADAGSEELDGSTVFLHLGDAQEFFGLGAGVHQVIVRMPAYVEDLSAEAAAARAALDQAKLEAMAWDELLPELKELVRQKRGGFKGMAVIVFVIVAMGVLNAMSMSTFERTREFGVMASLGTRRASIRRLVATEALLLGVSGLAVGTALAVLLLFSVGSIDFGALLAGDMMGMRLPSKIELTLDPRSIADAGAVVLLTVAAGGLWPAWRASRLKPVEATRYV